MAITFAPLLGARHGQTRDVTPPNNLSGLFDVGGHRLHLECTGDGTPTLILEHGHGVTLHTWDPVWPDLVHLTKVCRYDRAGLGQSEPGPVPTTSGELVHDLHNLLATAHLSPPYVMVGHSFGGMNVQLFAATYPSEVVGLVLIESSSRDYDLRMAKNRIMPRDAKERQVADDFMGYYKATLRHFTSSPEGVDWDASYRQLAVATDFGSLPLYVLTAGNRQGGTSPSFFPLHLREQLADLWLEAQNRLASRSKRSTHVIADGAGHVIQVDRPDLVIAAIQSILEQVHGKQ